MDAQHYGKREIVPYFTACRFSPGDALNAPRAKPVRRPAQILPDRCWPVWGALVVALPLALSGCANMTDVAVGTPLDQVVAQFGQPTVTCPADGGGQMLVWSTQPYGQYAWHTQTDAQGRVGPVRATFTDANFARLRVGVWTPQDVLCAFGPPAERVSVGLPSVRQIVWSYRYRQDGVWNSLMHVYFGRDGERVTNLHPGPDPLFEPPRELLL